MWKISVVKIKYKEDGRHHCWSLSLSLVVVPASAILRELKIQNNKNKYEAEMQAARQNYEVCQ